MLIEIFFFIKYYDDLKYYVYILLNKLSKLVII